MNEWFECGCPKCDATNLVSNGDTSDLSACDVEGFTCYSCGASVKLPEMEGEMPTISDDDYYTMGKPVPR